MQKWNNDKCLCDCEESNSWCSCINEYIWNPSTCDCECNKTCEIDEHLARYWKLFKRLFDKLMLKFEDEILTTTETLLDKKVT